MARTNVLPHRGKNDTLSSKKSLTRSINDLKTQVEELVRNVSALHPVLPLAALVERIIEMAEPGFLADLDSMLRTAHFLHAIRMERRHANHETRKSEWLFPDLREAVFALPPRLILGNGKTVMRADLLFQDTTEYLKVLDKRDHTRNKNDPKRQAILAIRKLWPRGKRASRIVTLGEIDKLQARKAGLIE